MQGRARGLFGLWRGEGQGAIRVMPRGGRGLFGGGHAGEARGLFGGGFGQDWSWVWQGVGETRGTWSIEDRPSTCGGDPGHVRSSEEIVNLPRPPPAHRSS